MPKLEQYNANDLVFYDGLITMWHSNSYISTNIFDMTWPDFAIVSGSRKELEYYIKNID